ncbi:MAG: hypothetical protein EOO57_02250 [Hymenobacter sp.]|nr:MAG: hypothetical protein EOO57_02250 [Hymenobacter sp.]
MLYFLTRRCWLLGLLGLATAARAQEVPRIYPAPAPTPLDSVTRAPDLKDKQQFAVPSVVGMGPSKGIIFHYERTTPFAVTATPQVAGLGDYSTDASKNAKLIFKGYIPAWNRPHLKVIVGLNYDREEFKFRDPPSNYVLFDNIENKGLKSTGVQLAVIRPVDATHWYLARVKGELSGDYNSGSDLSTTNYLRASAEAFYGWKRSPRFAWGVGFQYGYTFGRLSIYPAIIYNRTFNDRWGVEALFPARVAVRRNASDRSIFYGGYTVDGFNYIVSLRQELARGADKQPLTTLELRETEVKFRLRWERELLSFLWLGAEAGYRYNYAFDAFDRTNADRERIIRTKLGGAPYAAIELFAVPPRKLLEKAGVRR